MKTRAPRPQPGRPARGNHAGHAGHARPKHHDHHDGHARPEPPLQNHHDPNDPSDQEIPDEADPATRPDGPGTLYVVPTPIGDYEDLSQRALAVLRSVDLIAAEDTRETLKLLRHHGISAKLCSYHDFNEQARTHELIAKLRGGARIALVSDSGTPLISDPGYRVVRAVGQAGLPLVSLPGPCAAVTAAVASGLPVNQLLFIGFLPRKPGPRTEALQALRSLPATVVLYEAPHRLLETLTAAVEVLGPRPAAICRSLTKSEEEILRGPLDVLVATLTARGHLYGEYTVVIGGSEDIAEGTWALAGRLIARLLTEGMEPRRVRDIVAETLDLPRGAVYDRILANTST